VPTTFSTNAGIREKSIKFPISKTKISKSTAKTPETIKAEQDRLEKELKNMDSALWEPSQREIREKAESQKLNERKASVKEMKKK